MNGSNSQTVTSSAGNAAMKDRLERTKIGSPTTKLTPLPPTATVDGTENSMTKSKASNRKRAAAVAGAARGSASGPKFKIGDRVSVPVRFGETGTVKETKDGRYGVDFQNLPMTLWYDENELRPQTGKGFNWFRMSNNKLSSGGPLSNKTTEAESRRPLE